MCICSATPKRFQLEKWLNWSVPLANTTALNFLGRSGSYRRQSQRQSQPLTMMNTKTNRRHCPCAWPWPHHWHHSGTARCTHMDGVRTRWDVTDHQTTAPPLGHVGVTGVDQESVMDLHRAVNIDTCRPKNMYFNCETALNTYERPGGPYFIV